MSATVPNPEAQRFTLHRREALALLASMRFAVTLLCVICIASVIGTVVKQGEPLPNYVNKFGPFWSELFAHFGLFSVMMIAGTAALLYARDLARGYVKGALGGLVIGAACGIAAVGAANLLGDHPDTFLPYGVMICALVGAIGGLFGQYAAWIREFIASLKSR